MRAHACAHARSHHRHTHTFQAALPPKHRSGASMEIDMTVEVYRMCCTVVLCDRSAVLCEPMHRGVQNVSYIQHVVCKSILDMAVEVYRM